MVQMQCDEENVYKKKEKDVLYVASQWMKNED